MNLGKELFIFSRSFHALLLPSAFILVSGEANTDFLISVAALMFLGSFVFQYVVLHFTLKRMKEIVWRRLLLTIWNLVAQLVLFVSGLYLLNISSNQPTESALADFQSWTTVFIIGGAAAIGSAMTKLAFERYQAL